LLFYKKIIIAILLLVDETKREFMRFGRSKVKSWPCENNACILLKPVDSDTRSGICMHEQRRRYS